MKFLKPLILIAAFAFLLGIFYWALFVPKEDMSQKIYKTLKEQNKKADMLFKKVTFEEAAAGIKYWQLVAQTATVNKNAGVATLQKVEGTFFKKGKAVLKFRSPAAMWDMKKKEIYLDKPIGYDVSLEGKIDQILKEKKKSPFSIFSLPARSKKEAGYWFQAKNLRWEMTKQQIVCTGGIRLNKGEVAGYAQKLQADVGLEAIILEGSPWITMDSPGSQPVSLEAESFEILGAKDVFIARNKPKATWQSAQVTAKTARYLQADKKLELNDNVKINYKDISAEGDAADYMTAEQKIILSGNARAEQGENKMTSEKIMVSLKNRKISLLGKGKIIITD